jgi:hypothetical protein
MTKWCEELSEKFYKETYFIDRNDGLSKGEKKEIAFLSKEHKRRLMEFMAEEKKEIEKFLESISDKNYKQQIAILKNELDNEEDGFIERKERISAKFALKSVNNI